MAVRSRGWPARSALCVDQVDPHVAIGEGRDLDWPAATDQGPSAGEQLIEGERLAQVVVGPAVEAAYPVADRVARREEEHGRGPALAAMALQDLQAVRTGQPPVEDDEVPVADAQRLPGRVAVGGMRDGEALVRQSVDDRSGEARVVLDEQDPLSHDNPARFQPLSIAAAMDRTPTPPITTQPADRGEASPLR